MAPDRGHSRDAGILYLVGATLSLFGNAAITIVLPWLVLSRTGDPAAAAFVAVGAGIAAVPATFFSGRLIDRFGHRTMAVLADLGSAVAVAGLVVVDVTAGLNLTWFVLLGIAGAIFDVPGMTARQAMLADVARSSGYGVDKLAGLFQLAFAVAFLAGPGLAGVLLATMDPIDVVWLTAACSAGAALSTYLIRAGADETVPETESDGVPQSGWATIRSSKALTAMLILAFASSFITPPLVSVLLPGHFASLGAPDQLGLAMSSFAIGSLLGSIGYPLLARIARRYAFVLSMVALTTGLWLVATLGGFWLIAGGTLAMGMGSGLFGPVWNVYVAERVPEACRGQVLAIVNAASLAAGPLGLGVVGLVLMRSDLGAAAVVVAAVWTVAGVWALVSRGAKELTAPISADKADTAR